MDAAHIHSHFIVNAVCETGRMLHHGPDNLKHLRDVSDEICAAHQLSVLTSPQKRTDSMSSRECRSAAKGQSWKLRMMTVVDQCMWLETIAPDKLDTSTLHREKQDIARIRPHLGHYKLVELRPDADMRKAKNSKTGKPLSEATAEGLHSCLCGILSDAMEGGFIDRNPAWRMCRMQAGNRRIFI